MTRVRQMRAFTGSFDAVSVAAGAGIDMFLGDGRFVGPDAVEVDGQRLRFRQALIATGSGPAVPDLPGLAAAAYLTNETVFELTELPRRLVCLGAGVVNCEMAQALRQRHVCGRHSGVFNAPCRPRGRGSRVGRQVLACGGGG